MKEDVTLMFKSVLITLVLLWMFGTAYGQLGHSITIEVKHFQGGQLYLGNYYGKNTFLTDSTKINTSGQAVFSGKDTLPEGIYFVLYPQKQRYFELLIGKQQHFKVIADTAEHFAHLKFEHSPDNILFAKYNQYLRQQQNIAGNKRTGMDSLAVARLKDSIQNNIHQYRAQYIEQHPQTLLATLFKAMKDPVIPQHPHSKDSAFAYHYFRTHYWDGINFSDNSIVRTPILEMRLQRYFTQLVPPVPDSVEVAADQLLKKAKANKEVFKYTLWWLTSTYERSPYMGMDAVFVHLVEEYYVTGEAYWVKKKQLQEIIAKASKIAPNLIGNKAPELKLKTSNLKPFNLTSINAKYCILVFWDPTCGHCKITVPKLDSAYEHHWKKMGVKMVGILTGGTKKQWLDFIQKHHLSDWINLWDPDKESNYRQLYDVYMTPVTYLLDKSKKILAKQLDVKQLDQVLIHEAKESASSQP